MLPLVPRGPGGGAAPRRAPPWARPGTGSAGRRGQKEQPLSYGFRPLVVRYGECGGKPRQSPVGSREHHGSGWRGAAGGMRDAPAAPQRSGCRSG